MNQKFILIFFATLLFCGLNLFGQEVITGRVVDKSGDPIETAAVYINGSTLRTSTSSNGTFELRGVGFPCQLVVSFLGYETTKIKLEGLPGKPLMLYLIEKDLKLSEVAVEGKDMRKQLTESFRNYFLGWDTWGKAAVIMNENALIYNVSYDKDTVQSTFSGDLSRPGFPQIIIERNLKVYAKEPLQINLPLLGYTVTVDLDYFSLIDTRPYKDSVTGTVERERISRYIGSFFVTHFVTPYEGVSATKQRRFERNRKEAYYNSKMHFLRSLYSNELLKNGFVFIAEKQYPENGAKYYEWVDLNGHVNYDKHGNMHIYGLTGKKFEIIYVGKPNGTPIDMSGMNYKRPVEYVNKNHWYCNVSNNSTIYFINDTCTITPKGVTDNGIMFNGKINQKKAGAILPDNYAPEDVEV
jgi:hypothetical protein